MRCLVVAATLALAGAVPSPGQEPQPTAASSPAEEADEATLAEQADLATDPAVANLVPRKPSPFVLATYDRDGGPGFGLGLSVPVGSRRSVARLVVAYSLQFPDVPRPDDGWGESLLYTAQHRNRMYAYAGLFLEAPPPAAVRPYAGITLGIDRDYSKGHMRRTKPPQAEVDFAMSTSDTTGRLVLGLLLGRGRRCPFVEITAGRQAQIRASGGVRF